MSTMQRRPVAAVVPPAKLTSVIVTPRKAAPPAEDASIPSIRGDAEQSGCGWNWWQQTEEAARKAKSAMTENRCYIYAYWVDAVLWYIGKGCRGAEPWREDVAPTVTAAW
jgi:hypothetical protein